MLNSSEFLHSFLIKKIEQKFIAELYEETKNPFANMNLYSNLTECKSNEILLNNIKMIPKVGDKTAQILIKTYKSID